MDLLATRPSILHSDAGCLSIELVGDPVGFSPAIDIDGNHGPDIQEIRIRLTSDGSRIDPPPITIRITGSAAGIQHTWRLDRNGSIGLLADWNPDQLASRAAMQAPIICLHGRDGSNRITIALADTVHGCRMSAGIREEDARLIIGIDPFEPGRPAAAEFLIRIRIDRRQIPYYTAVRDVGLWWEKQPGCTPMATPEAARQPMYSTWYSFHQQVDPAPVMAECRAAAARGCTTIIVDDGWQTMDTSRGYHFAGDWHPDRIPDMTGFVAQAHAMGMRVMIWYAVPMMGDNASCSGNFAGMALRHEDRLCCSILDPRFPQVRNYLAGKISSHLAEWGIDGVKLDFVDMIHHVPGMATSADDGRDLGDLDDAVDLMMQEIATHLRTIKPDVLVEFRQSYIGPRMRTFGNMFRAGDCPYDAASNRSRTVTLRLLSGSTAVHSDMLMWHPDDAPTAVAAQLQAVLFAVPQISVRLTAISPIHDRVLTFWLSWWSAHRTCLLDGILSAEEPELGYTIVSASDHHERIIALYADRAVRIDPDDAEIWIINATALNRLIIDCPCNLGERLVAITDCMGAEKSTERMRLEAGLRSLPVPYGGLAHITRTKSPQEKP